MAHRDFDVNGSPLPRRWTTELAGTVDSPAFVNGLSPAFLNALFASPAPTFGLQDRGFYWPPPTPPTHAPWPPPPTTPVATQDGDEEAELCDMPSLEAAPEPKRQKSITRPGTPRPGAIAPPPPRTVRVIRTVSRAAHKNPVLGTPIKIAPAPPNSDTDSAAYWHSFYSSFPQTKFRPLFMEPPPPPPM
jgi:hypothetical protein